MAFPFSIVETAVGDIDPNPKTTYVICPTNCFDDIHQSM
jgi:hypothetical protein